MPLAKWNGPFDALTINNGILRVGDPLEVTDQDLESAYWLPADQLAAAAPVAPVTAPASSSTTTSEAAN